MCWRKKRNKEYDGLNYYLLASCSRKCTNLVNLDTNIVMDLVATLGVTESASEKKNSF